MRIIYVGLLLWGLSGTAQVKKVEHDTPLICPDQVNVDLSLGVMQNGVGVRC